ncbi:MAG: CHAP domain-containing protein [Rhodopila sp.]
MPRIVPHLLPLLCLALGACGSNHAATRGGNYVGGSVAVECAPFARALTGVHLSGAAADWWSETEGRYRRSQDPDVGSLLVFRRSSHLPSGHVAVVSEVVSSRQILVSQANWVHHRITEDQAVIDVSAAGNWSMVRVFWPPSSQMGTAEYPTYGFIRPDHPRSHRTIAERTPEAVSMAKAGW